MESEPIEEYSEIKQKFEDAEQGHVFKYYDEYTEEEKIDFLDQCRQVDLEEINKLYKEVCVNKVHEDNSSGEINPVDRDSIHNLADLDEETKQKWTLTGARQINKGKVGLLVLAGGMGSRLGSNDPKGMYNIGLPSNKSIFQVIAERFKRVQRYSTECCQRAGENCAPRYLCMLYIMTSNLNHETTIKYFKDNNYFGIKEDKIMFFMQSSIPTITFEGKIMLETRKSLSLCPNGNGALFKSLATNQDLQESLKNNSVEYIHIVGVDNILNKFLDPLQVGLTYENSLKGSSKFIQKAYPTEPIGVFVMKGKVLDIIEYTELGEDMSNETLESGEIKYNQGNIVNFLLSVEMLNELCTGKSQALNSLYHCAIKKIPEYNEEKDTTEKPDENNGYKLELFVQSFLPYVEGEYMLIEGIRAEEFAPVKNKEGTPKDSPTTAREMISKLHASWVKNTFPDVEFNEEPSESFVVELPFDLTYQGENIALDMISEDLIKK